MKSFKSLILIAIAFLFVCAVAPDNKYSLVKDYVVTIHGTSNLHDWDETVETVSGAGIVNWNTDGSFNLDVLNIKMEVISIKSNSSIMNNNTYKALKGAANPQIIFSLSAPVKSILIKSSGVIDAKGKLNIAGVTKAIDMKVKIVMHEKGKLAFEGSQIILMTDYGIIPPTALFGSLKTGDKITLAFKTNFISAVN